MSNRRFYDENDEVDARHAAELEAKERDAFDNLFAQDRREQAEKQEQRTGTIDEDEFDD